MDFHSPTVTFLLAELAEAPAGAIAPVQGQPCFDAVFRAAVAASDGICLPSSSSVVAAVFIHPPSAIAAVLALYRAWQAEPGASSSHRLRSAIHMGLTGMVNGICFGATINRARQLLAVALPDQILISRTVAEYMRDHLSPDLTLHELGLQRLKDLLPPEPLFLLQSPDLPSVTQSPRTLLTYTTNLPTQPTPFLGREREVQAVRNRILGGERLITLVAPSGFGKTRFALEIATRLLDHFPQGVFFVSLAPIEDPELVLPTIARTLGLKESGMTLLEHLQQYLYDRRVLLVIDNIEQVVASAASLGVLLEATQQLVMLVTSHVSLQLPHEAVVAVPTLELPDLARLPPVERLIDYTAIALFLERVQAVQPGFVFDAQSGELVVRICARLGGIPLAIELVAAYGDTMDMPQLLQQIQFYRGIPPDQPLSLSQVLDWSYSQLEPATQTLLARLGVFVEGCTLEAAEAICSGDTEDAIDVVNEVAMLLQRNLLEAEELDGGDPRYIMLDCIHDYALARLQEHGELAMFRQLHAAYYRDTCRSFLELSNGSQQEIWLRWMTGEQNNLRTAFHWVLSQGDHVTALQLAAYTWLFGYIRGYGSESLRWLEATLPFEMEAPLEARAHAHNGASLLYGNYRQHERAKAHSEQSLALFRELGDLRQVALILHNLGLNAMGEQDFPRAKMLLYEALELQQSLPMGPQALTPCCLGLISMREKDDAAARTYLEMAVGLAHKKGEPRETAATLIILGAFQVVRDELEPALNNFREAIILSRPMGGIGQLSTALDGLAWIASAREQPWRAARLLGAADAYREATNQAHPAFLEGEHYDQLVQRVRSQLNPSAFDTAWTEGRALTLEAVVAFALEEVG